MEQEYQSLQFLRCVQLNNAAQITTHYKNRRIIIHNSIISTLFPKFYKKITFNKKNWNFKNLIKLINYFNICLERISVAINRPSRLIVFVDTAATCRRNYILLLSTLSSCLKKYLLCEFRHCDQYCARVYVLAV